MLEISFKKTKENQEPTKFNNFSIRLQTTIIKI